MESSKSWMQWAGGVILLSFSLSGFSAAGCCSHHGGVSGCDAASKFQKCMDGSLSPTCLCSDAKAIKAAKPAKPAKAVTTKTTFKKSTEPTVVKKKAEPKKVVPLKKSTAGCCSRHGGVSHCNTSTGFQMCKDGSMSTTCKCQ